MAAAPVAPFALAVPVLVPEGALVAGVPSAGVFNCASVATCNVINDGFSLKLESEKSLALCTNPNCTASMW